MSEDNKQQAQTVETKETQAKQTAKLTELITGNEASIISAIQDILKSLITTPFSSCRIITLHQMLATSKEKQNIIRNTFILSCVCTLLCAVTCILDVSLRNILMCILFLVAGLISNSITSKKCINPIQPTKKEHTKRTKQTSQNDIDDIIL